jgi:hypothetical protein
MYTLDFNTIRQMMLAYHQTGLLTAEVPSGVMGLRGPCRIEVVLSEGRVTLCTLISVEGEWLKGKEAEQVVMTLGRLNWTFTAQAETKVESFTSQVAVTKPLPVVPYRLLMVRQEQMRDWPRLHRSVFALVDGTKDATKIAGMLSVSPNVVEKALNDLQSIGVIAFGR